MNEAMEYRTQESGKGTSKLQVLHLEDSPSDAELIKLQIQEDINDCVVTWIKDREGFEEAVEEGSFDIILIDYDVPGFLENEAISIAQDAQPFTPIICVTGAIGEGKAISMLRSGATDYVLKDHLEKLGPVINRAHNEAENQRAKAKMKKEREGLFREVLDREIRYRMLFEAAVVGMALIDAENMRFIDVNEHLVKTLGHPKEYLMNKHVFHIFKQVDDESAPDDAGHPDASDEFIEGEFIAVTSEGTEKCFDVNIVPGGTSNKTQLRVASFHDITERKAFKKRMLDLNEELEERVQSRTAELEGIRKDLEQSLEKEKQLSELKSQFVSIVSHQFRTPLTVIKSSVSIISMQKKKMSDEIRAICERTAGRIDQQIDRMTELMEDVLEMGRINADRVQPQPEIVSILPVVEDVIEHYNEIIEKEGREVHLEVQGEVKEVFIDPQLLEHALSNLISNALKYSEHDKEPLVRVRAEPESLHIDVIDEGIGIPEADIENLFSPFFRASNVDNIEGTGLGLAIVKEYVEKNNGSISMKSEVDKGTQITMTYPSQLP